MTPCASDGQPGGRTCVMCWTSDLPATTFLGVGTNSAKDGPPPEYAMVDDKRMKVPEQGTAASTTELPLVRRCCLETAGQGAHEGAHGA